LKMNKCAAAIEATQVAFVTECVRPIECFDALHPPPDAAVTARGHFPRAKVVWPVRSSSRECLNRFVVPLLLEQPRSFRIRRVQRVRSECVAHGNPEI